MKEHIEKEIRKLNISLELMTYLINVPIAAGFAILTLRAYEEKFIIFVQGVLIAIIFSLIFTVLFRTHLLKKLVLKDLNTLSPRELKIYKLDLFKIPVYCGSIVVQLQWIIGIIITAWYYCNFYGFTFDNLTVFFLIMVFLAPINFTTHAAKSDIFLGKCLNIEEVVKIELTKKELKTAGKGFTNYLRIFLTFGASVFFVIGTMFVMHLKGVFAETGNPYKDYALFFIFIQSFIVFINSTNVAVGTIEKNIDNISKAIQEFSKGNLSNIIPIIDTEELALVTADLDEFRKKIIGIIGEVQSASNKLTILSSDLQNNSSNVANQAQTQAAFSEEISAALEEFSSSIIQSEGLAMEQLDSVNDSITSLTQLESEIEATLSYSNDSSKLSSLTKSYSNEGKSLSEIARNAMEDIKNESVEISEYTKIIADIAERVGLLSLNASIEAARAGAEGRGFAVVATEISKLGDSTNENSSLIQKKVISLSRKVQDGYQKNQTLLGSFSSILSASEKTDMTIEKMNVAMKKQISLEANVKSKLEDLKSKSKSISEYTSEQKISINAFNVSVDTLKSGSEQLAISADSLNSISHELSSDAKILSDKVSFFKVK